jgi:hypothetical protein
MTNYNDGNWHGWNGGECPVHPNTEVDVGIGRRYFGETTVRRVEAKAFNWDAIRGFRVINEYKEPRSGHDVNRWHSNPYEELRNSGDTINTHQWRVAEILLHFWPDAPGDVINYARTHDEQEKVMGDIPSTEKVQWSAELRRLYEAREAEVRAQMGLPKRPAGWRRKVEFCDKLDAYRWVERHCPRALADDDWQAVRFALRQLARAADVEVEL